jgi:hypothetical protein
MGPVVWGLVLGFPAGEAADFLGFGVGGFGEGRCGAGVSWGSGKISGFSSKGAVSAQKPCEKRPPKAAQEFREDLSNRLAKAAETSLAKPVRIWVLDEHRYGLLPVIRRVWGRKGVRVHALYKTTYQWGYLHEALEVDGAMKWVDA